MCTYMLMRTIMITTNMTMEETITEAVVMEEATAAAVATVAAEDMTEEVVMEAEINIVSTSFKLKDLKSTIIF